MKYIDAEKLIVEIKRYKNKADERLKIKGRTFSEEQKDLALQNLCGNLLHFITSLQQDKETLELCSKIWWEEQGWIMIPPDVTIEGIDSLLRQVKKKLQQEQSEVDLEEEYKTWWNSISCKINVEHIMEYYMHEAAHHFYELGKNSK